MPTRSRADRGDDGLGHLDHEAGAVLRRTAVGVGALVGAVGEELLQQVAVGRVQLDAVEAGRDRAAGGVDELLDHRGQLVGLERARRLERVRALAGEHLTGRAVTADGATGVVPIDLRVGDPARMHQLGEDHATLGVHGVRDGPPALDLLVGVQARRARVALAHRRGLRALGDDQAGPRPLGVVRRHRRRGDAVGRGPVAGHRRHDDAVGAAAARPGGSRRRCRSRGSSRSVGSRRSLAPSR